MVKKLLKDLWFNASLIEKILIILSILSILGVFAASILFYFDIFAAIKLVIISAFLGGIFNSILMIRMFKKFKA